MMPGLPYVLAEKKVKKIVILTGKKCIYFVTNSGITYTHLKRANISASNDHLLHESTQLHNEKNSYLSVPPISKK